MCVCILIQLKEKMKTLVAFSFIFIIVDYNSPLVHWYTVQQSTGIHCDLGLC